MTFIGLSMYLCFYSKSVWNLWNLIIRSANSWVCSCLVTKNKWLHLSFFAKHFPQEYCAKIKEGCLVIIGDTQEGEEKHQELEEAESGQDAYVYCAIHIHIYIYIYVYICMYIIYICICNIYQIRYINMYKKCKSIFDLCWIVIIAWIIYCKHAWNT